MLIRPLPDVGRFAEFFGQGGQVFFHCRRVPENESGHKTKQRIADRAAFGDGQLATTFGRRRDGIFPNAAKA